MFGLRKKEEIESKRNMLRFMCHELRSPLFVATAGLKLLDLKDISPDNTTILNDVESELNSGVDLLNSLLEFEKYQSEGINIRRDIFQHTYFAHACSKLWLLAKTKNIEYEVLDQTDINVKNFLMVDNFKIEQVLRNMITNAVKYSPECSKVTVSLNIVQSNRSPEKLLGYTTNELVISVKDTGYGISLQQQDRVFQQFQQFSTASLGGSGLGLWISKKIAELHDGTLTFFSEGENMGSTFSLTLPLHDKIVHSSSDKSTAVASVKDTDEHDSRRYDTLKTVHVLIADDSAMNRKYLGRTLNMLITKEMNDMLTTVVTDVDDGIGVVDHIKAGNKPDVVFMDNIMKTMHGPEAAKELRALGYLGVIVGVSGNVLQEDINSYLKAGATFFLNKPIDTRQLVNIMDSIYWKLPSTDNV